MPEIPALVDVEALLISHFHADGILDGLLGDDHVSTQVPADFDHREDGARWLQVFRVSGSQADPETGWLDRALVQLHGYGDTEAGAFDVIAQAHRSLYAARDVGHARGVVTAIERVTGPTNNPDPTSGAPRYSATYRITVHPLPTP